MTLTTKFLSTSLLAFAAAATTAGAQTLLASAATSTDLAVGAGSSAKTGYHPMNADIQDGTLKIDGFVAKLGVNEDIHNAGYLYIFLPGTGTAVVSLNPMAGATKVAGAFHDKKLTFSAGGREFVLASDKAMLTDASYADAYVRLDDSELTGQPVVGSGDNSTPNPGPTELPALSVVSAGSAVIAGMPDAE
jgi:hypothetical protein